MITTPPLRLGIYNDGPFVIVETEAGDRVSPDPADFPFLTFACAVGTRLGSTLVFCRTEGRADAEGRLVLPREVDFEELPYYESLVRLGQVLRATPGTVQGFWRGLSRVDAVWVFGPHPFAFVLVGLALVRRRKVVLGVRQDTIAYFRGRLPNAKWSPALLPVRIWNTGFHGLARMLKTTVVGDELARSYGRERSRLLPIAVALVRDADVVSNPPDRDWTGRIGLLTVGRVDQEKNPLLLVEAMAELARQRPGRYRLTWAGTGPLEHSVRERAVEAGVSEDIEMLGFVPFGPALLERYRSAHVFVHVSFTEGVPAVLIEAFASGTPVVATAVGGVPAALDHGRAGLLVPPADLDALVSALKTIVDDSSSRDDMVKRGLQLARESTLDVQASRVAAFMNGSQG